MKKTLFLLGLFFSTLSFGQQWETDFTIAQGKAQQQQKKLLLVFSGSDWCIPCIRLEKEVWRDKTFIGYAKENLILYRADFPKRKKNQLVKELKEANQQLAEVYNPNGYFPWVVVFDSYQQVKGTFVYTKTSVSSYIEQIKSF